LSSLGDIILTEPVSALIRRHFPDAVIDYITKPSFKDIVELFPEIDNVYTDYQNRSFLKEISAEPYDYAIDLHNKLNSRFILHSLKSKRKLIYRKDRHLRSLIVQKRTAKTIDSTLSLYLSAVEGVVDISSPPDPRMQIPEISLPIRIKKYPLKIGVFPGASYETKRWPGEYFKTLCDRLIREKDAEVFIMGSKSEQKLTSSIARICGDRCHDLGGALSLNQLAVAVSQMDLLITNDSGPMHLASAYKKPLIALFGATHPKLGFAPMNPGAVIIQKEYPCRPCSLHGGAKCPLKHFRCMQDITPADVFNTCMTILKDL
jgi:lipopolysaccharide heptosyltransferase II